MECLVERTEFRVAWRRSSRGILDVERPHFVLAEVGEGSEVFLSEGGLEEKERVGGGRRRR